MRIALDTSAIVAGILSSHRHQARAIAWLDAIAAGDVQSVVCVHALGEVWSVLTKLPLTPPMAQADASRAVGDLLGRFEAATSPHRPVRLVQARLGCRARPGARPDREPRPRRPPRAW
jgi:predicted nucleic acid-binding protein